MFAPQLGIPISHKLLSPFYIMIRNFTNDITIVKLRVRLMFFKIQMSTES